MATCIHSSRSCLPPFYTIPIFPLFKSKDFSFTCHIMYMTFDIGLSFNGVLDSPDLCIGTTRNNFHSTCSPGFGCISFGVSGGSD